MFRLRIIALITLVPMAAFSQPGGQPALSSSSNVVSGNNIAAASCAVSDVQSAVNSARDADTVIVPSGTCTWTSSVNIFGKGIRVTGAGSGRIIAYDNGTEMLSIGTGTKIISAAGFSPGFGESTFIAGQTLRIFQNNARENWMQGTVTSYVGSTLTMDITSTGGSGSAKRWLVSTVPSTVIINNSSNTLFSIAESMFVHDGTTFNMNWWIFVRGGTYVVHDNVLPVISSQDYGMKSDINMTVMNLQRKAGPNACWGAGTTNGRLYPAPCQVGFGKVTGNGRDGKGNATYSTASYGYGLVYVGDSEPAYAWNNRRNVAGTVSSLSNIAISDYGSNECTAPDTSANYIKSGRDYFNSASTAKPGYTSYTYPHPLRSLAVVN